MLSPLLRGLRRDDLPLLNYQAGYAACYGSLAGAARAPRILVAGCGTFEPIAVAKANPGASILAVDFSAHSLRKLRWQARLWGLGERIRPLQADIETLREGGFDYVVATGVLHHLENPARGLKALVARAAPRAVFRVMLYSRWGRELLYGAKELARALGVKDPAGMRKLIAALPPSHPYRLYFHLYSDTATDAGLADGYLHPCDQPFDALSLREFLRAEGLRVGRFLHRPSGQPEAADQLAPFPTGADAFDRLQVLDALAQMEENYCFFAGFEGETQVGSGSHAWNPALPARGRYFSRLLGREIAFDRREPRGCGPRDEEALRRALFLLPEGA
jgi:SAM-dependent methyltransferase